MKIVYASRTGNIQTVMNKLNLANTLKIETGLEEVCEDFILFTYNDGAGVVPPTVDEFLKHNHKYLKGVVGSGNRERHPDTWNFCLDIISKEYNVPVLYKINTTGTDEDLAKLKEIFK